MQPGERQAPASSGEPAEFGDPPALGTARMAAMRADFIEFYDDEYLGVVRFLIRCGASPPAAEDAAQEAFVEAWARIAPSDTWADIASPRAWIRTVAHRRYRRPAGPRRTPPAEPVPDVPETACPGMSHADLTDETLLVLDALRSLRPDAQAVMAFHLDGFTGPEIAAQLGMSAQQERDLLKQARKVLARHLAGIRSHEGRPAQ
jgi:RNA polymerase sigma factor (sigma-70 family)